MSTTHYMAAVSIDKQFHGLMWWLTCFELWRYNTGLDTSLKRKNQEYIILTTETIIKYALKANIVCYIAVLQVFPVNGIKHGHLIDFIRW